MKSKWHMGMRLLGAGTVVSAFLFGISPITVQAGGCECTCDHKCTWDAVNEDCELCSRNYKLCYGAEPEEEPEETGEEPKDTPEEHYGPLTPDGNMILVDDYGAPEGGKQFITVTTKSGNYFYLIIDRDDNGNEKVHFLNLVDESDLLALMDDEEVESYLASKGVTEKPAETAEEKPVEKETPEKPEEDEKKEPPKKKNATGALGLVVLLMLGGAGGYVYFKKVKGSKKPQQEYVDPDADYAEDEDYLSSLPEEDDEEFDDEAFSEDGDKKTAEEEDAADEDPDADEEKED
ncbi:MAG: DUF4366 domain-containing protein [Lachnospiraceae bacterium]|nr:DUF4366 domain-containing protein [Lachnospiraceae bacterium]